MLLPVLCESILKGGFLSCLLASWDKTQKASAPSGIPNNISLLQRRLYRTCGAILGKQALSLKCQLLCLLLFT